MKYSGNDTELAWEAFFYWGMILGLLVGIFIGVQL